MSHIVFNSLVRSQHFLIILFSVIFTMWSTGTSKSTYWTFSLVNKYLAFGQHLMIRCSLNQSMSPQISANLLNVPFDLNDAEFWMVSVLRLIYNSLSHFQVFRNWYTGSKMSWITLTLKFYSFFTSLTTSKYNYITLLRIFHANVSWWLLSEVWGTISLKSPEPFSVSLSILIML